MYSCTLEFCLKCKLLILKCQLKCTVYQNNNSGDVLRKLSYICIYVYYLCYGKIVKFGTRTGNNRCVYKLMKTISNNKNIISNNSKNNNNNRKIYTTLCCKNRDLMKLFDKKFIVVVFHVEWTSICMSKQLQFKYIKHSSECCCCCCCCS